MVGFDKYLIGIEANINKYTITLKCERLLNLHIKLNKVMNYYHQMHIITPICERYFHSAVSSE